jgi:DNA-binding Xre family transcriptional regulator
MKLEPLEASIMTKRAISTFEREMKNPAFKKAFNNSYKEFLLSELLIAMMEADDLSVRKLAKEVGLSPTVIQKIRSGEQDDVKVSNFVSIVKACGYSVILEKGDERIIVEDEAKRNNKHQLHFIHI